jgi:hypothetical protein
MHMKIQTGMDGPDEKIKSVNYLEKKEWSNKGLVLMLANLKLTPCLVQEWIQEKQRQLVWCG